jgi:ribose transport system permease protein
MARLPLIGRLDQQKIVLGIAILLFILFSILLPGFATQGNILTMLQSVAIIGVLGNGMAIVIIGRGIDLSMISVAVMPVAWAFVQIDNGASPGLAFAAALLVALAVGVLNGWLVAYVEVPAIFATLATGTMVFGAMQFFAVKNDIINVPPAFDTIGGIIRGQTFGVPHSVVFFAIIAALATGLLRYTVPGRYIYAVGDNPQAARTTGVPMRPILILQYTLSALVALAAGYVLALTVESANTRIFNSTMIYDVILIVVLGGVGLGGGKGRISNVLIGTALIGILINGMTIMDLAFTTQNLIKATILLIALIVDSLLNPRDEQTSQQGDI